MTNPFMDFLDHPLPDSEAPLEEIVRQKENVLEQLESGCRDIVRLEAPHTLWRVDLERVAATYTRAVRLIREVDVTPGDFLEFWDRFCRSDTIAHQIPGPTEIYLAAMINLVSMDAPTLDLDESPRPLHFLGYRLPLGRTLRLRGEAGDFTGCCLAGGKLTIQGSVGAYCGAGMTGGSIEVEGSTEGHTGQWIHGGNILVHGAIGGLGSDLYRGSIRQGRKYVFQNTEPESTP